MDYERFTCHSCGEEIVPDRTALTYYKHKDTDDNVCRGGGTNATPERDPWERVKVRSTDDRVANCGGQTPSSDGR